jgi:hypothetical protein
MINRELLKQIKDEAIKQSNSKIDFIMITSDVMQFPLEFTTPDYRYKVFISWEPEIIRASEKVTFFVDFQELFTDKSKKTAEYDLTVIQNDSEIFNKHLTGNVNSDIPNSQSITFDLKHSGTANLFFSNINGNSLSKGNFIIVIEPPNLQTSELSNSEIPSWIKNNAGWWADGSINDDSFVQGIEYLIKTRIITVN